MQGLSWDNMKLEIWIPALVSLIGHWLQYKSSKKLKQENKRLKIELTKTIQTKSSNVNGDNYSAGRDMEIMK